jgi:hypothetical protein
MIDMPGYPGFRQQSSESPLMVSSTVEPKERDVSVEGLHHGTLAVRRPLAMLPSQRRSRSFDQSSEWSSDEVCRSVRGLHRHQSSLFSLIIVFDIAQPPHLLKTASPTAAHHRCLNPNPYQSEHAYHILVASHDTRNTR